MRKTAIIFIFLISFSCLSQAKTLTLREAVDKTLKNFPQITQEKEKIKALLYGKKAISASRWLKVNFQAGYERHNDPVAVGPIQGLGQFPEFSKDIYSWDFILSFPIFDQGETKKEVEIKELEINEKQQLALDIKQRLSAQVQKLYYRILYLKELIQKQQRILDILKRQRENAAIMFKNGKIPEIDLLKFDEAIKKQEANIYASKESLKISKKLLAIFMGENGTDFDLAGSIMPDSDININYNLEPEKRPDIKAAIYKVKQAAKQYEKAKLMYMPRITAFASYGKRYGSGLDYEEEIWTAGIKININIFDSGVRKNIIAQRHKMLISARNALETIKLKAKSEILSAEADIKSKIAVIKKLKAARKLAEEIYKREAIKYNVQAGSVMDLLSAHSSWLSTEASLMKAFYELKCAEVDLEKATGQIYAGE